MSNKPKKSHHRSRAKEDRKRLQPLAEDRRSVALTVAWMMSTLATAAALALAAAAYVLTRSVSNDAGRPNPTAALPSLLLFIALVTGVLTLVLIPIVYRVRPAPPPLMVTIGSACIAATPWIVLFFRAWT